MDTVSEAQSLAVVIGHRGTIGAAVLEQLRAQGDFAEVIGFARPELDLLEEASIAAAAAAVAARGGELRHLFVATGLLHDAQQQPEKSWRALDPAALARSFAVNATGPALIVKHFAPLLPRSGRSVIAFLSARAGSIGENNIGGWYAYRAAKSALNQIVRSAAAELGRGRREALCVTLHPGHVESPLSAPFGAGGHTTFSAEQAATHLLTLLARLTPADSGGFYAYDGERIPF
jgi:NAD(P)-dependent dehydrogenase (short-subunit alcohol dehydrogenase family)